MEQLVEKLGPESLSSRDEWGYTPAHWAALDGNVEVMRYLIERGAPVDMSCLGIQGPKPIHWACRKGHTAIVHILLQAGVSVNTPDFKGLTPLMTACMFGRAATAAFLLGSAAMHHLTDINGDTALHWAAYKGHPELIRILMYSGVDLQKADNFGSTALHLACLSGNFYCVKILCEKRKIELEPRDKNGKTPLMLAKSHRHDDIVSLLNTQISKKNSWFPPIRDLWSLLFGGAGQTKIPILFFVCSVLFWVYPMYILRVVPLTWDLLRRAHYCFIYWNCVMWLSWLTANRKDPGYVPTNSDNYFIAIKQIPYYDKWKRRDYILSRLCHTCRCIRPLRAKHCRVCDRCVAFFDHHCPFIYNCVGIRNRMWFFVYVISVAINCSFAMYFSIYQIYLEGADILFILALAESFLFVVLGWTLTCTSVMHACMNLTTNEMFNYKRYPYLRDKRGKYLNPFSRGPLFNLIEFFICTNNNSIETDSLIEDVA
uniref:Palmitoyltransferase n=1 Tax=Cacopsylla melanoneura TaxID=428564 RepID=A0A8D8V786_9HEMI